MQGDYSLSIAGTAPNTDAVRHAVVQFVAALTADGATVSSGTFTASESVENLVADTTAHTSPVPIPQPEPVQ